MENEVTVFDLLQADPVDWTGLLGHPLLAEGLRTGLFGTTILSKDPPVGVVRSLVRSHRDAIFCKQTYSVALHTPLHCACERGSHPDIIKMIIDADPSQATLTGGVRWKVHPIHIVRDEPSARLIAAACPGAVVVTDCYGRLPLHHAAGRAESSPGLVKFLVEQGRVRGLGGDSHSGGVFVEDEDGVTPLSCAQERVRSLLEEADEEHLLLFERGSEWRKLIVLVRAGADFFAVKKVGHRGEDGSPTLSRRKFCLLHALLELDSPEIIVRYGIRTNSSQLREKDRRGRLPLAIAASNRGCSKGVIELLLDSDNGYPSAAGALDGDGRLALHLAAETGRTHDEGLESLFNAAPKALECRDTATLMFPFMLASTSPEASIDTVYKLLRESPNVLQVFCDKTRKRKRYKSAFAFSD